METPRIRILLPTYEPNPAYLRTTLDAAMTQTEERWTLHINDDASATNTRAIVEPYLSDHRITFARNPRRLGIGGNWNACLGEAQSAKPDVPFIQFLFQDDFWSFDYLERMCGILENHPTVGFVSGEHEYDCEEDIPTTPLYRALEETRRNLLAPGLHNGLSFLQWWLWRGLHPNFIGEPSFVMMRRRLIERVGTFDRNMPQYLDVEYWTRCLATTDWYFLAGSFGTFRVHSQSASARNRRANSDLCDRLLCIERALALARVPKTKRTTILGESLAQMLQKMHQPPRRRRMPNPSSVLPFLCFCVRHPILCNAALLRSLQNKFSTIPHHPHRAAEDPHPCIHGNAHAARCAHPQQEQGSACRECR
ncbi:glycosyltransferase family 2 protein [Candidatus Peregrinibacteria bacterium]|nr:glycosyltransferase family 2 protein [Candidatus Peregrinibacteria bacterium]